MEKCLKSCEDQVKLNEDWKTVGESIDCSLFGQGYVSRSTLYKLMDKAIVDRLLVEVQNPSDAKLDTKIETSLVLFIFVFIFFCDYLIFFFFFGFV